MNTETNRMMFAILRSAVCDEILTSAEKAIYNADMLPEMEKISKHHDVINILAYGLRKNGLLKGDSESLETELLKSVYRYTKLEYELNCLCNALESAEIPFIPLKGSVIRKYYPEPWLRTSCDIDVLIHSCDLDKAKIYLQQNLKYKYVDENEYHVSFGTQSGWHIEMHFDLIEDNRVNSAAQVLKNVWNTAVKHAGCDYWYEMTNEMFYFYHITHMAKHFTNGGCGIRPFVDIFVLKNNVTYDEKKRDSLLIDGGLKEFSNAVGSLSNVWFNNAEHTDITLQMQDYILRGGVFGTDKNYILIKQQKLGGKLKYMLYKIFFPYKELKKLYPILKKHRWLTPIMEVRRWFRHIFCFKLKRAANELKFNNSVTKSTSENVKNMLDKIGL